MPRTDHGVYIKALRMNHTVSAQLAADLLELHDTTSLSLDDWDTAKAFVRSQLYLSTGYLGHELIEQIAHVPTPNGV